MKANPDPIGFRFGVPVFRAEDILPWPSGKEDATEGAFVKLLRLEAERKGASV